MTAPPSILFLDFDGVLNTTPYLLGFGVGFLKRSEELSLEHVARLNQVLAQTSARVVVTSTWRIGSTVDELQALLDSRGFVGEVLGMTPDLFHENAQRKRGEEISRWLEDHEDVSLYAVVDDDPGAGVGHEDRFVLTSDSLGLTDREAARLAALL